MYLSGFEKNSPLAAHLNDPSDQYVCDNLSLVYLPGHAPNVSCSAPRSLVMVKTYCLVLQWRMFMYRNPGCTNSRKSVINLVFHFKGKPWLLYFQAWPSYSHFPNLGNSTLMGLAASLVNRGAWEVGENLRFAKWSNYLRRYPQSMNYRCNLSADSGSITHYINLLYTNAANLAKIIILKASFKWDIQTLPTDLCKVQFCRYAA